MTNQADEIARKIVNFIPEDGLTPFGEEEMEQRIADALRSYRNGALEEAAKELGIGWSADVVRSLKTREPQG